MEFLTRLRHDARLYALPPEELSEGKQGPKPKWDQKLPPPRRGGRCKAEWRVQPGQGGPESACSPDRGNRRSTRVASRPEEIQGKGDRGVRK